MDYWKEQEKAWRRVAWLSLAAAICAGIAGVASIIAFFLSR